jgi:hypothetical protein
LVTLRFAGGHRDNATMIEPVFADTKFNSRIDRFLRRDRSAARSEWRLANTAHNRSMTPPASATASNDCKRSSTSSATPPPASVWPTT